MGNKLKTAASGRTRQRVGRLHRLRALLAIGLLGSQAWSAGAQTLDADIAAGGQRRPVALRTRHGDRFKRIRLENQPEADGLRCLPVVRDKHLDRVVEVREFNRRPGAGEPPVVAPQQHGVRLRWT